MLRGFGLRVSGVWVKGISVKGIKGTSKYMEYVQHASEKNSLFKVLY
jgi:hypothetical protein